MSRGLGSRFWWLWCGSTLANLADGVYKVALPLLAVQYTRSPLLIALVSAVAFLPWLLLALHVGALLDRWDRRRIMVNANVVRFLATLAFVVLVVTGRDSLLALLIVVAVVGVAEVFFDSGAQSTLPDLVDRDDLGRANGRLFGAREVAESFAGRAVGGVLVAVSVALAFATPAVLYAGAAGVLLALRGRFRAERPSNGSMTRDIADGVRYLWRHRLLRTLALATGVMNLSQSAVMSVFVLFAVGPDSAMGLPEYAYGWLLTATAAGSALASLLVDPLQRLVGRVRLLVVTVALSGGFGWVLVATASVWIVAPAFVLLGIGIMLWNVVVVTLRQRVIPDHLLGRVNSCYRMLAWGLMPVGALLGGVVAEVAGLRGLFALCGALSLSLLMCFRVVTEREIARAEDVGPASP
ncbi:MFS transporter [Spiractinospora alimapuensis]|uniref:MFS transporter n=1 Tax=Spiractinospora alimapuensis TaxID=2820884 RepID=UPI001F1AFB22|nr:MFS transporter [Spiractinospora alimapuensis]QVQ52832.1 MFS transporter [Spiractinospora alimapuensis]